MRLLFGLHFESCLYSAVGVAVVGLTNNVPVRLSSSSEELAVSHSSSNFTSKYIYIYQGIEAW